MAGVKTREAMGNGMKKLCFLMLLAALLLGTACAGWNEAYNADGSQPGDAERSALDEELGETEPGALEKPGAAAFDPDHWEYEEADEGGIKIVIFKGGSYSTRDVAIPPMIDGNEVKIIGAGAFRGLRYLRSLAIPDTVTELEDYAISDCESLEVIEIPCSVKKIADMAIVNTKWNELQTDEFVVAGDGILIGFNDKLDSRELAIPDGVKVVKSGFAGETFFANQYWRWDVIHLPLSVESIEAGAFRDCFSVREIHMRERLREIGDYAFARTDITELKLPASLEYIGYRAFWLSRNLKYISFPDGIQKVEAQAFGECRKLREVAYEREESAMHEDAFEGSRKFEYVR